jgi:zinc protease
MKSGLRLLLLPDDELPVVRGYLYVRTGSVDESPAQLGLAELTGNALRAGGTQKTPADAFDEALADRAAEVNVELGREFGLVTFKCLKEDLPQVVKLVFEMLREPAFDPQKLELKRLQMFERLRRQNDDPMDIANREFPKLIYGPDSVWARTPTPATVRALSRDDVIGFHRRFFYPDRMILALSGDFGEGEVLREIEKQTQGWGKAPEARQKLLPVSKQFQAGTYLIPKPTDQATVILGHFGDKRFNPDKYALLLLNEILGGDPLTSRLGKRVRSSLGLVYGISSRYGLSTDYGIFSIVAQTKSKSTGQVVEEIRAQLQDLVKEDSLSEEEMEFYKSSLLNSLFSEYEPKYNFARDEARFEYFDYPPNYLQFFREKVQAVTLHDVRRVAKKYLRPDALQVLIVGDPRQIGPLPNARIIDISQ